MPRFGFGFHDYVDQTVYVFCHNFSVWVIYSKLTELNKNCNGMAVENKVYFSNCSVRINFQLGMFLVNFGYSRGDEEQVGDLTYSDCG